MILSSLISWFFLLACVQDGDATKEYDGVPTFNRSWELTDIPFDSVNFVMEPEAFVYKAALKESSGLAPSFKNRSCLWTHEDSGSKPAIYLIDEKGNLRGRYRLKDKDVEAFDYEDIACGPGPEEKETYIYLADTGDNMKVRKKKVIYRFKEPSGKDLEEGKADIKKGIKRLEFKLEGKKRHDMEAMLVDPVTRDIYLFSKRNGASDVYVFPFSKHGEQDVVLNKFGTLPFTKVVAADISADGEHILVKTYNEVYYWKRNGKEHLTSVFSRPPVQLPYRIEPQGESICWDVKAKGFFTVSERRGIETVYLNYYKRK